MKERGKGCQAPKGLKEEKLVSVISRQKRKFCNQFCIIGSKGEKYRSTTALVCFDAFIKIIASAINGVMIKF